MGRLGVILGSNAAAPGGAEIAAAAERSGAVVSLRHGVGEYRLPHLIDHGANLGALAAAGCDRVLGICSVGSLDAAIGVGSFVCPHDFIALGVTITTRDDASAHATVGVDAEWRRRVISAWPAGGAPGPLRDGGVYWQTNGPRFETVAEVQMIAAHADLVGMTMASECIVAGELGLSYAAICVVDNLANGIAAEPLSAAELERDRTANAARLREALDVLLPALA